MAKFAVPVIKRVHVHVYCAWTLPSEFRYSMYWHDIVIMNFCVTTNFPKLQTVFAKFHFETVTTYYYCIGAVCIVTSIR
jgi:hypothetical protein